MRKGFTLLEMLVTIALIVTLMSVSLAVFHRVIQTAERSRSQEIVTNAATGLALYYQQTGFWPKEIITAANQEARLDENISYLIAKAGCYSLNIKGNKLVGLDKFGLVDAWAYKTIKALGGGDNGATKESKVLGNSTIGDRVIHFAIDLDGDGLIQGANVGGEQIDVRATAIAWSCGRDGKLEKYSVGRRKDDIYSWAHSQTVRK